jgi:AraC-like ligand binding domain
MGRVLFISPSKIHFFNYSRQLERIMIDNHLGKMALAVLVCTPFPSDLLQKQPDELLSLYRQVEGLKSPQRFIAIKEINQNSPNWFKQHYDADHTEIIYIQGGNGHFTFEDKHFVGKEGDIIIFNPFSKIEGKSCFDNPLKGISVSFSTLHINGKGCLIDSENIPIIHLQEEKMEINNS